MLLKLFKYSHNHYSQFIVRTLFQGPNKNFIFLWQVCLFVFGLHNLYSLTNAHIMFLYTRLINYIIL